MGTIIDSKQTRYGAGRNVVALMLGGSLLFGATPAFAAAMPSDTYVTAAASRAAGPAPEILGLTGVEESGQFVNKDDFYDWEMPKYQLFGNAAYNALANPYFVDLAAGLDSGAVENDSREGGGGGPNASLAYYGEDATDDAVWEAMPDVIVGTGGTTDYEASAAEVDPFYTPIAVAYSFSSNSDMIDLMYNLAAAGDEAAENTGKQLRYGSAEEIAREYEAYVRGIQGYVLAQQDAGAAERRVVASVEGYDAASGTYTLRTSGVAEGTASTNRYLEVCENVADNLPGVLGTATATAGQLAQADLVLVGGQQGGEQEGILDALEADKIENVYYAEGNSNGSAYGVVMNSVENAQNVGRILGCLYPELFEQDDLVAYYYDHFYHINDGDLAEVMDGAMDGVRNWDSTTGETEWTVDDAATYSEAAVQAIIDEGVDYLRALGDDAPTALQLTDHLA